MNLLRKWLVDVLTPKRPEIEFVRGGRPGQSLDRVHSIYAPGADGARYMPYFALNIWVYTAVSKMAAAASSARLRVFERDAEAEEKTDHPLLDLIGPYGRPNDDEDALEFLEAHLTNLDLAGNSYWYWFAQSGGAPTQVFQLEPNLVRVVPGSNRTVSGYVYKFQGHEYDLKVEQVTHFKRTNPFNRYYGMSALQALQIEVESDMSMARWNSEFFGPGVTIPAGILIVPDSVTDAERERLDEEMNARYGEKRKTAILRAEAGSTVWHDAGLRHHEIDFGAGRLLTRKAVFNALDLPEGLYSEASTEAHARVAERFYYGNAQRRLDRTASKLNAEVMGFWPGHRTYACGYLDLRRRFADWQQEEMKVSALRQIMTVDEIRAQEYNLGPKPEEAIDENSRKAGDAIGQEVQSDGASDGGPVIRFDRQQAS